MLIASKLLSGLDESSEPGYNRINIFNIPLKLNMRSFFKNPRLLPGRSILFITVAVSLLAVSMVQVNCPICSVVTDSSENSLKVLEIKVERTDFKIEHAWCVDFFIFVDYIVEISVANEGSESLSAPLFITGTIPEVMAGEESLIKDVKLIWVEVPGRETKKFQEHMKVTMFGDVLIGEAAYQAGFADVPEVEFSVITDPNEIRANCPICEGKGRVSFTGWIRAIIQ